jgi:hypothetical protein
MPVTWLEFYALEFGHERFWQQRAELIRACRREGRSRPQCV